MKYEYTGRHIEVTPALRSHVEEHFQNTDSASDARQKANQRAAAFRVCDRS